MAMQAQETETEVDAAAARRWGSWWQTKCQGCHEENLEKLWWREKEEKEEEEAEEEEQGSGAWQQLCTPCTRRLDFRALGPLLPKEERALDLLGGVQDSVPWSFWKPGPQPAQVLPWLFLGDFEEALDIGLLKSYGIGAVLNVMDSKDLPPHIHDLGQFYRDQHIQLKEVWSWDRLSFDIIKESWPAAKTFLAECKEGNLKVLLHCYAGMNRSAALVVAWLVEMEGMLLTEAVRHTQSLRGTILCNNAFRLQLVRLALSLDRV